jgi:hypothetical protein
MAWSYPVRVEPKCEQTIFSRSNYQFFWFATRWFGNFREVSRPEGESRLIPFKNGLGVRFGSDNSGTPSTSSRKVKRPSGAAKTPKRYWIRFPRTPCPDYGTWRSLPRYRQTTFKVVPESSMARVQSQPIVSNIMHYHPIEHKNSSCALGLKWVCGRLSAESV